MAGPRAGATTHADAVWPRQLLLSRAFASQASCYVILASGMRAPDDVPEEFRELGGINQLGDSYYIDPRGEVVAGPAQGETILTARGSLEEVLIAKAATDGGGHYSRPDIFQLHINRQPLNRVSDQVASDVSSSAAHSNGVSGSAGDDGNKSPTAAHAGMKEWSHDDQ